MELERAGLFMSGKALVMRDGDKILALVGVTGEEGLVRA